MTDCCENGIVDTQLMRMEFDELQNPPAEFMALIQETDKRKRNQFLLNMKALNNMYGFASVHGKKAPTEMMGGRNDTCKYNGNGFILAMLFSLTHLGQFSFQYSDLIAPTGSRPTLAQTYVLDPNDAMHIRKDTIQLLGINVREELLQHLDLIMRNYHPFGKTFAKTGDLIRMAITERGEIPAFKVYYDFNILKNIKMLDYFAIRSRCGFANGTKQS